MQKVMFDPIIMDVVPNPNGASKDIAIEEGCVWHNVIIVKSEKNNLFNKVGNQTCHFESLGYGSSITKHSSRKLDY